jgi:hypothetical protein
MKTTQERIGFFNTAFEARMAELGISAKELANRCSVTYEHIRKLIRGQCLPSPECLQRLSVALDVNEQEMLCRVETDRAVFKFGDAAWEAWGVNPRMGVFYMLFPVLTRPEQDFVLRQLQGLVTHTRDRRPKKRFANGHRSGRAHS